MNRIFLLLVASAAALAACDRPAPMGEPGQADPFEEVAAEHEACVEDPGAEADGPDGLRIAAVTQLGPLAPGGEATLRVTLVDVSGDAFMDYPAVRLVPGDAALSVLTPDAGQWFGIFGCGAQSADFTIAADAAARDDLLLTVEVSTLRCMRDGECGDWHAVDAVIAVD